MTKSKDKELKKLDAYKPGDFCYYLDNYNKISFAEIKHVRQTDSGEYYYEVIDQKQYRFITVEHRYCADEEKLLKKKKRSDLQGEYNGK